MKYEDAIHDFEAFVKDGEYLIMKQYETFLKQAKSYLREQLKPLPGKRHVFLELNMIAKFVAKKIKATNHERLIEDLFDYIRPEMALPLLSLDVKQMKEVDMLANAAPFLLPDTYYVRPTFNKAGKRFTSVHDYLFGGQSVEELLTEIQLVTNSLKTSVDEYEKIKDRLFIHPELVEKSKVSTTIGSVSRIAHQPSWDMKAVLLELGEDFIKSFGKVKVSDLDEWVLTGCIPKSIVTRNQTIEDIQLDFIVMELDVEEQILNIQKRKRARWSIPRYA